MTARTSTIYFVNHREFLDDILAWEPSLPEIDAFVGIPRSGVLPAATLALRRNVNGALCADWIARTERREVAAYERHVREAAPRFLPQYPIYAVATNRLPHWRKSTEEWLERHGVRYARLIMSPCETYEERNAMDRPRGTLKGKLFRESEAVLFVESDCRQARVVAEVSGKPTLALDRMKMFG